MIQAFNALLMQELAASQAEGKVSDALAQLFIEITDKMLRKPQFVISEFRDEMRSEALLQLCRCWHKFDCTKYDNPFAYFTQCVSGAFCVVHCREMKQRRIESPTIITNDTKTTS